MLIVSLCCTVTFIESSTNFDFVSSVALGLSGELTCLLLDFLFETTGTGESGKASGDGFAESSVVKPYSLITAVFGGSAAISISSLILGCSGSSSPPDGSSETSVYPSLNLFGIVFECFG